MSSRPNGSPPPYEEEQRYIASPQPAYSYYPDDEFQHFYRWSSPPGILKIMAIIVILLCVAIFACVASTLAWDSQGAMASYTGMGYGSYGGGGYSSGGYNSYGGAGYGGAGYGAGTNYGYGVLGGNYNDPRSGKGFMIAMAGIVFVFGLAMFIVIVSHQRLSESRRFYLALVIICAILALFMLIATMVYFMAINPSAQSTGSIYGNQIAGLCSQYQQPQLSGVFVNQYLYHYCVVEPQEAIAVVFGFLVTIALIIMLVFALKTRQKIQSYGKSNIFWKKLKMVDEVENPPQDVEAWVNNVNAPHEEMPISEYPEKLRGSRSYLDDESTTYDKPPISYTPQPVVEDWPLQSAAPFSDSSDVASSVGRPKKRRPGRPRRTDGQDYDTDYNSSGDELDDNDFDSEFPPITNEQVRNNYKREFDHDHQEYKDLQAELDAINKDLSDVDRDMDQLEEGSPQYLDAVDEYNRIKDIKKSPDYLVKKRRCKYLKQKLNHIKKMVSDFDRRA